MKMKPSRRLMVRRSLGMDKQCSKCGEIKPLDAFRVNRNSKGGRTRDCKACLNNKDRKWRASHAARLRENSRARAQQERHRHPERVMARRKKYEAANPDRVIISKRTWYEANKTRADAASRRSYLASSRNLSDSYVAHSIVSNSQGSIRRKDIPHALIDAQRARLQIHRLLKEINA